MQGASTPPSPGTPRVLTPLWRNVSFTLMWTSTAASGFGDRIIMLAALVLLGGMVQGVPGDGVREQGAINFFFFLPYLILSIPGGWLADRLPRKWVLLGCDEARALVLLIAFFMAGQASGAVVPEGYQWRVLAVMFAIGCFAAIFAPARNSIVPQIVPLQQLQPANAVLLSITTIASMIGMLVGGRIIDPDDGASVRTGVFLCFLFYAISGFFFAFMRLSDSPRPAVPAQRRPRLRRLPSATRYILQHKRIMRLLGIDILVWAGAMVVFQATLPLVKRVYDIQGGAAQLAAFAQLATALGIGMIAGAGVIAFIRTRRESDIVMFCGLIGAGICALLLAVVPLYGVGLVLAFGVGLFGNVTIISITSLLQSLSPNWVRGRIMGVSNVLNTTMNVAIAFALWQTPEAGTWVLRAVLVLGPLLVLLGLVSMLLSVTRGPHPEPLTNILWRLDRLLVMVWHRLEWRGRDRVPHRGAVILAANHTTGLDPFLIQGAVRRRVRWLMLTSYRFRLAEPLWRAVRPITLDASSRNTGKIRAVVEALEQGDVVGLFPEGSLQRERRQLGQFHGGIGVIAKRSGAAIVPVWIDGTPQRRWMIWHFLQPSRSRVTFGEPWTPPAEMEPDHIVAELRKRMLSLSGQPG